MPSQRMGTMSNDVCMDVSEGDHKRRRGSIYPDCCCCCTHLVVDS